MRAVKGKKGRITHEHILPFEDANPPVVQSDNELPLVSFICPVCDPPLLFLKELVQSVHKQSDLRWELCLVDDASTTPAVREYLHELQSGDKRIKVVFRESRGHIARASQDALEIATGEWVALIDHDDKLFPGALKALHDWLNIYPNADVIYSDELVIDQNGDVIDVAVKPSWDPLYFLSFMYVGHLTVYSKRILQQVGGFRPGYEGSQDYDLLLRVMREARNIRHIPQFLYAWRAHAGSVAGKITQKMYAFAAAEKALDDALKELPLQFPLRRAESPYPGISQYEVAASDLKVLITVLPITPSRVELLTRLKRVSTPYVFCYSEHLLPLSEGELRKLLIPLALPEISCSAPLLSSGFAGALGRFFFGRGPVAAAGYTFCEDRFIPNLAGDDGYFSGPGFRLYAAHSVDALSSMAFCFRTEELRELLKTTGEGMLVALGRVAVVPLVTLALPSPKELPGGPLGFILSSHLSPSHDEVLHV